MQVQFLQTVHIDDADGSRRKMSAGDIVDASAILPGCLDSCLVVRSARLLPEGAAAGEEQTSAPQPIDDELDAVDSQPIDDEPKGKGKGKGKGKKKPDEAEVDDDLV